MRITLSSKPYRRAFALPLKTSHGRWDTREGWLLRMQAEDASLGFGEVAPLPCFNPHESMTAIAQALHALPATLNFSLDNPPLTPFPSVNFGLETAFYQLLGSDFCELNIKKFQAPAHMPSTLPGTNQRALKTARLLPSLCPSEAQLQRALDLGYTTFKVKIATQSMAIEQAQCIALLKQLPPPGALRLDANGGLSFDDTESWLQVLAPFDNVEFLEQPMRPGHEAELQALAKAYPTAIALDESIVTLQDIEANLRYFPQGPFIIKPALFGSPTQWLAWRSTHPTLTIIYSSALETAIGYEAALRVAHADPHHQLALGFGVAACFDDAWQLHPGCATLMPDFNDMSAHRFESLWQAL